MKTALVTGITGQDGSYLAEFLLEQGYKVYGLTRRASFSNTQRLKHLLDFVTLIDGDLLDQNSINRAVQESMPDEVYNLAAQSFVPTSWKEPELTAQVTGLGALRVLEAVRQYKPDAKFYQASSSEMFGTAPAPQNENTPFHPRSPYAVSKIFAHYATLNYRESFGIFGVSGILFNHESPRRGIEFITKKVCNGVARIAFGLDKKLVLGNLEPKRDWGFARDYVKYMWKMLQQDKPDIYVIGSGETHTIKELCDVAFYTAGLDYKDYVIQDPNLYRPAEIWELRADTSHARDKLGFVVETSFEELVELMVLAELKELE